VAVGQDGEVAVGAGAGLERFAEGPGLTVVAAEVDRHIAPGGVLAVSGVRMGEKQERSFHSSAAGIRDDAGHAAGFEQFIGKDGLGPVRGTIRAARDEATALGVTVAYGEEDATIGKRGDVGLARIGNGDAAAVPGLSGIVADEGADRFS